MALQVNEDECLYLLFIFRELTLGLTICYSLRRPSLHLVLPNILNFVIQ